MASMFYAMVDFADIDGDGMTDFLFSGSTGSFAAGYLFRQNTSWVFSSLLGNSSTIFDEGNLVPLYSGFALFDYFGGLGNNLMDFIFAGMDNAEVPKFFFFVQNSSWSFSDVNNVVAFPGGIVPGLMLGSVGASD